MPPRKTSNKANRRSAEKNRERQPAQATRPRWRVRMILLGVLAALFALEVLNVSGVLERLVSPGKSRSYAITDSHAPLSPIFRDEVLFWREHILQWAKDYQINPNVIALVIQIESCGDAVAVSGAGALGLMQVMPFHFDNGENMLNPDTNVRRGMDVFYECLTQFAQFDLGMALACYNGGPGVTLMEPESWVPETRYYYEWATGLWAEIVAGKSTSETLASWLASGGQRLCDRAAVTQALLAQNNHAAGDTVPGAP